MRGRSLEGVPMIILSIAQRAGLALLLGLLASAAPLAAAELEEEIINRAKSSFATGSLTTTAAMTYACKRAV